MGTVKKGAGSGPAAAPPRVATPSPENDRHHQHQRRRPPRQSVAKSDVDDVENGAEAEAAAAEAPFEPTVEMMVDDYDDERTLDEEERLAAADARHDPGAELSSLRREGDMPLDELLAMYYGARPPDDGGGGGGGEVEGGEEGGEVAAPPAPPPPCEEAPPSRGSALRRLYRDDAATTSGANAAAGANAEPGRLLRSVSRPPSEEEDDRDYSPDEDERKKTIMVGQDYQARIPDGLRGYDDALPYENEDKLLWNPSALAESVTEEYMARARALRPSPIKGDSTTTTTLASAIPCGDSSRDDEQALYLLQQCGHDVEEALRRRRISAAADAPQPPIGLWSEEECRNFEGGLKAHGKDFRTIRQLRVRTRSVGELVQFYYIWKKTERHDAFANKARLDKKKYALHPGHADYMDRFLEEQDGGGGGRDSPGSKPPVAPEAPPDPLAVGPREVFSELSRRRRESRSPDDTDREPSPTV